jgi:hypothetical protein
LFEVDPDAVVYVKQLAVPSGTGSNVAAEQCGRGDQMGITPDEARCPGLDMQGRRLRHSQRICNTTIPCLHGLRQQPHQGPRIVAQMSDGFIVGSPTWPAWTPAALQTLWPA